MRLVPSFAIVGSLIAGPGLAATRAYEPAALLVAPQGQWQGELQYRDYQSNKWEGLPVKVSIVAQGDGVSLVRTAAFDDGPKTGTVWITTLLQIDPVTRTITIATARAGRPMESGSAQLDQPMPAKDTTHWVLVETGLRRDGNGMAQVRETTTRDGNSMITLKEVNPVDDGKDDWLPRNRTVLKLVKRYGVSI